MELITIQGKTFVAGLYWQTLSGATPLIKSAREAANQIREGSQGKTSYNAAVLRNRIRQVGFGESFGPIKQLPSLAATLAESPALAKGPSDGWIVRLRIPGNVMLVMACIGGAVLPEGDFVGTEEHALERMNTLKETYGNKLSEIIEQDNPEISNAKLADWISGVPKKELTKLRSLKPTGVFPKVAIGIAVLIILVIVVSYTNSFFKARHLKEMAEQAAAARERASEQMQMQEAQQAAEAALGPDVVQVGPFMTNCFAAFALTPLSNHGWELSSWICNGIAVTSIWDYMPGASMTDLPLNSNIDPLKPGKVVGAEVINPNTPKSKLVLSKDKNEAMKRFYSMAQYIGADQISFQWIARPAPDKNSKVIVAAGPENAQWAFTLKGLSPFDIVGSLNNVNGLSLKQIVFETVGTTMVWKVEGNLYASH